MKKTTLAKTLVCSLSVVALMGIIGCDKKPMPGKKTNAA